MRQSFLSQHGRFMKTRTGTGVVYDGFFINRSDADSRFQSFCRNSRLFKYIAIYAGIFYLQDLPKDNRKKETEMIKKGDIQCEHVSFTYSGAERQALSDVSISIQDGEKIADCR